MQIPHTFYDKRFLQSLRIIVERSHVVTISFPFQPAGATIDVLGKCARQGLVPKEIVTMKRFLVCTSLLIVSATLYAQTAPPQGPPAGPPKSPPATATATFGGKTVTITYSSPRVRGREGKIFGTDGLISHDKGYPVWRAGANAATTLHTETDLELGPKLALVPKGDYTLFVDISNPDKWALIVSKQTGQSPFAYDKTQDLVRVEMGMEKPPEMVENLTYTLDSLGAKWGGLTLSWEYHTAVVPIYIP
jgi:hypothetical protein